MALRDSLKKIVPVWLSDRRRNGLTVGFRFFWAMVAPLDTMLEVAWQGFQAWLGIGTPTALPFIGRSRGILRGRVDTDASYLTRLRAWLDTWPGAGSEERVARAFVEYLGTTATMVRVIQRGEVIGGVLQPSQWLTLASDGTVSRQQALWDWDTVSHPERSDELEPYWSDLWVIVQVSPFEERAGTLGDMTDGDDGYALGHRAKREEVEELVGQLAQWKGAHSRYVIIWCTDPDLFNPADQDTCPDGTWGAWGIYDGADYVPSGRNITSCRYWEPD